MASQQRLFDGNTVEQFKATLSGFEVEDTEVEHFRADEVLVLLVTATVDGAMVKRTKDGGWERTNKLTTGSVRVVTGEMRSELIDIFHLSVTDPQLAFAFSQVNQVPRGEDITGSTAVEPDPDSPAPVLHPDGPRTTADQEPIAAENSRDRVSEPGDPLLRSFLNPEAAR